MVDLKNKPCPLLNVNVGSSVLTVSLLDFNHVWCYSLILFEYQWQLYIYTFVLSLCLSQTYTIKKSLFSSVFISSLVSQHKMEKHSYQVYFGWPPRCCLSYRACRVLSCRFEWSISPQAYVGTSYRTLLLHILSLEGFPALLQPEIQNLYKMRSLSSENLTSITLLENTKNMTVPCSWQK